MVRFVSLFIPCLVFGRLTRHSDECKKRKLKCIPVDESSCQRCIDGGLSCVYAQGASHAAREKSDK